ncbi:prostaglandin reductase-3 [Octopus bimaculoides]|uniref:15-oxoprostaglandin 13-reductase n=1 Tax=Octopus bimaculoides TaxID=37653 RepID=A0A0L8ICZ0_OCTBM|nr:prostaglandin reductase-3 [Octopus bimaculoides]XP_052824818.1 prostaglandin reductase-3 [Octopus bimaculoides]|eukprot:XP_014776226.1 PREDICTED: zinc-binding alcohol dehydrogenase domain-containing protein 2-like [Octopus bimaculoides]
MSLKQLPSTFRKLVVNQLSKSFRDAVSIKEVQMPKPAAGEVLVKNRFVGINASDINFTAGKYDPSVKPPFDCGFEALGEIVDIGADTKLSVGQSVMYMLHGAFAEYKIVSASKVLPLPYLGSEFLPLLVSGLTASLSLDQAGCIKSGETVLVTAAAGGTGQFAVQWAKHVGCHVIGTCSSDEKVEFLKSIGCDRPINYKKESVKDVLKTEFPNGIDIIYESVGGEMFETCLNSLAVKGRLIIIGYITQYHSDKPLEVKPDLPRKLLTKSASLKGFFLPHYFSLLPEYINKLITLLMKKEIKSFVFPSSFTGLEMIPDAVESLYKQAGHGKIVVELNAEK